MSSMNEQALKERVRNIAQAQGRTFNNVWQEVLLERWLVRLVASKYSEKFVFKGAMCLVQYLELDRETRDLDFLVKGIEVSLNDITSYLNEVCSIDLKDGFTFVDLEVGILEHTHMKYPGHAVSVYGVLGHYPDQNVELKLQGGIYLHGHSHGNTSKITFCEKTRVIKVNVCLEQWEFRPVSLTEVINLITDFNSRRD